MNYTPILLIIKKPKFYQIYYFMVCNLCLDQIIRVLCWDIFFGNIYTVGNVSIVLLGKDFYLIATIRLSNYSQR